MRLIPTHGEEGHNLSLFGGVTAVTLPQQPLHSHLDQLGNNKHFPFTVDSLVL